MKIIHFILCLCLTGLFPVIGVWGQRPNPEFLDFDRPEAWASKYFTTTSILSSYSPPAIKESGALDLDLEIVDIPELGDSYRRVGFNGTKLEDLNKSPIFVRPLITYYFKPKISLTLSYAPPIEVWDVTPHIFSGSINWTFINSDPWRFGLRFYGQVGTVEGAFTCPPEDVAGGDDPLLNPFGCVAVSNDTAHLNYYGIEFSGAYQMEKFNGLTTFFSLGVNHQLNEFDINSTLFGEPDIRTQKSDGNVFSLSGGLLHPLTDKIELGVQVFYAPLDVIRFGKSVPENDSLVNVRFLLSYSLDNFGKWFKK